MDSTRDLLERNLTFFIPGYRKISEDYLGAYFRNLGFWNSTFNKTDYFELASRIELPSDYDHEQELWERIDSPDPNSRTAVLGTKNKGREYWHWYHHSEEIVEMEPLPFEIHKLNKKWQLKKVYSSIHILSLLHIYVDSFTKSGSV